MLTDLDLVQRTCEEVAALHLRVADDGCGFDPESVKVNGGHWGMSIMRERAEQIGANQEAR